MSDFSLSITKQLPVSPEVVFDAWTTPEQMASWFSPMTTASVPKLDLQVGGEYQIDMHAEGKDIVHTGKYLEIDRPNRLKFSWISEGTQQKESIVTVDFKAQGSGTLLTLTHDHLPTEESKNSHQGGWIAIADKLEQAMANKTGAGA